MTDYTAIDKTIAEKIEACGVKIEFVFIPKSQSRNKADKYQGLNYKVRLSNGNLTFETDYSMGVGHCPVNKATRLTPHDRRMGIEKECETGVRHVLLNSCDWWKPTKEKILPNIASVINSLVLDSSALESFGFESWCADYGYDTDSIKANETYTACVETGIKMRALFGEDTLKELKELLQDY